MHDDTQLWDGFGRLGMFHAQCRVKDTTVCNLIILIFSSVVVKDFKLQCSLLGETLLMKIKLSGVS